MPSSSQTSYTTNTDGSNNQEMNYPLFTFSRGRCTQNDRDEMSDSLYKPLQQQLKEMEQMQQQYLNPQKQKLNNIMSSSNPFDEEDDETEEFVLL